MEYKTGTLVEFRSRPWVVQQSNDENLMILKPLGGTDAETVGIYLPLYGDNLTIKPYNFRKPSTDDLARGYQSAARTLYDACRLSFRDIAGPFQCLGRLSFEPRPYQLVPLILALKQEKIRLLISDDVGIGKTLESLLIAKELLDRHEISRFAVVCLPHLCEQWQNEIKDKFGLDAEIIRSSTVSRLEKKLRAEKARMLGFDTFAAYELDEQMAHDPATVDAFLDQIQKASNAKAKEEVYDMQKIMDEDIAAGKLAKGSRIQPWDWFYYAEKVRQRKYALDEEQTKPYFKMENVRKGIFTAAHKLYGINVEPLDGVPVYNPAVETFKVTDADGSLLGIFMTDYYPRSSKRGGAWMNVFRDQYVDKDGNEVRPIVVNVGNMASPTETEPALFSIDNVETVFHEFGHALHGLLTKCAYPSVSGTSVKRDFVETFSQFNENWAFQPEILAEYATNYKTGEVIPDSLVAKINNARKFNQGFMTSELCAASILDMKWHELTLEELEKMSEGDQAANVAAFEEKVCKEMGLIDEIIPRYRTTYFNHIFNSGYCAGYYSYLWAEVLDKDAFEYFQQQGLYDPHVADKFRRTFLERGGSEEPMVLYMRFKGSEPDPGALLRARGLE